jgi:PBP1b-binding outer membrane lipoprotein LpoB
MIYFLKTKSGFFCSLLLVALLVLSFIALSGCTKYLYVCSTGEEVEEKAECKVTRIDKNDAENFAKRYVSAYFSDGKSQLVSSYLDLNKGGYFVTFIVSEKNGAPYETVVLVDKTTGKVTCNEKCNYVTDSVTVPEE